MDGIPGVARAAAPDHARAFEELPASVDRSQGAARSRDIGPISISNGDLNAMVRNSLLVAATLVAVTTSPAAAQFGPSPRAAGVAGAFSALATGYEAIDWNPANLALGRNPSWSVAFPRLDATGTILGPNIFDIRDIFNKGGDLTDRDRTEFLADIPATGFDVRADVRIPWVAVSVGPFAVGASTTAQVGGSIGKELVDLMLYARQYGDIDRERLNEYRVGDTALRDAIYTTFAASYARELNTMLPLPFPVTVGVTGRYVLGHDLQRGRIFEPRVDLNAHEIYITALSIRSREGSGYGLDIGVAAQPLPNLTVGLSVENVVQRMKWDEDLELRGDVFAGAEFSDLEVEDIYDRLEARPFDPNGVPIEAYELVEELLVQSYFPRVIRLGAGLDLGSTKLGATLKTTQGKGELTTGWPTYLALGAEQRLPVLSFLTLRAGIASSLDGAVALSAGTSLNFGPLALSVAASRASGNDDGGDGSFDPERFAERIAAGSGYGFSVGLALRGF
jgi:hypothetical protein